MSIIAKSLKKIRDKDSSTSKGTILNQIATGKSTYFNIGFYAIVILFFILIIAFVIDYYFFVRANKKITDFNISKYEKIYYSTVEKFKKAETAEVNEMKIKYYLMVNDLKELEKYLEKIKSTNDRIYLKYKGIVYFKEKKFNKALDYLSLCMKRYNFDVDVISYLANIYFIKGEFPKAIMLYKKIKKDNFETAFNKAVIYENNGNLKSSLKYYKKSYMLAQDPLLKKRIFNKIFLMENYESR